MKRGWCGSSWPAEALGSPCHEGAGDLEVPNVTEQKKKEKKSAAKRIVFAKYRDEKARSSWVVEAVGGWRVGEMKG
ncbi:hypothetical protein N7527_001486 [Penicillium freii]|nr:hypothetical protein N7527_001486 [Penicillium freii]